MDHKGKIILKILTAFMFACFSFSDDDCKQTLEAILTLSSLLYSVILTKFFSSFIVISGRYLRELKCTKQGFCFPLVQNLKGTSTCATK